MTSAGRILVTGAGGFVGRWVVAAARRAGHPVTALVRQTIDPVWDDDEGVRVIRLDLGAGNAAEALAPQLEGTTAVIHAAARLVGGDSDHARDTLEPTRAVVDAIASVGSPPRLVLVGSLSVYGVAELRNGALLDEDSPLEPKPENREAYGRAKLAQEQLVLVAAEAAGFELRRIRVGLVYGPGHLDVSRVGIRVGPFLLMPHGRARIPLVHVSDCAHALVRAATAPIEESCDVVNVVAPGAPTQNEWRRVVGLNGVLGVIPLPLGPMMAVARVADVLRRYSPALDRQLPTILHAATLAARFRPLTYDTERAERCLGLAPTHDFRAAVALDRDAKG